MIRFAAGLLMLAATAAGLDAGLSGQASGWLAGGRDSTWSGRAGLRYIPELSFDIPLGSDWLLDAECSAHGWAGAAFEPGSDPETDWQVKPYRAWLRLGSAQFDARAGLQKLNFGSALLLRPLQWFDRLDPRDPLGLTDGVYGLLLRYYFLNNTNLWAWGLLGNENPKGIELHRSVKWSPEAGGRIQVPVPRGEVAASFHLRRAVEEVGEIHPVLPDTFCEQRVGIDAKWDIEVGLACEATVSRQNDAWQRLLMLGADYTLGLPGTPGIMVEHLVAQFTDSPVALQGTTGHSSGLSITLPVSLLDNVSALVFYDWTSRDLYRTLMWRRTYDDWTLNLIGFWNPDRIGPGGTDQSASVAAGKGVQLLVTFDH